MVKMQEEKFNEEKKSLKFNKQLFFSKNPERSINMTRALATD